jgi:hypothetical protein
LQIDICIRQLTIDLFVSIEPLEARAVSDTSNVFFFLVMDVFAHPNTCNTQTIQLYPAIEAHKKFLWALISDLPTSIRLFLPCKVAHYGFHWFRDK